jgi:hypothetical protein
MPNLRLGAQVQHRLLPGQTVTLAGHSVSHKSEQMGKFVDNGIPHRFGGNENSWTQRDEVQPVVGHARRDAVVPPFELDRRLQGESTPAFS